MPRIVRFHQIGGPEVLKIENEEVSSPGEGEVQIGVKAIGLNRAESVFRLGRYFEQPILPSKLGYEASGVIKALGKGVTGFNIGDAVSTVPSSGQGKHGVYGELINFPSEYIIKNPSSLSFVDASAIWMQYLTAYGALIDIANIQKGDFVVIPAASSSVGLAAIQLTRMVGAIPIATTRTNEKKKALLDAGAAHVIVTSEEDTAKRLKEITQGKGARVVFDPVAGSEVHALAEGMAHGGILFIYGKLSNEPVPFPLLAAMAKGLSMRGYILFEIVGDRARFEKGKKFILDGLSSGKLKPIIAKTFTLDQIVDAHRFLESNQQFGKICVTV